MTSQSRIQDHRKIIITTLLLLCMHTTSSAKPNSRPVYEVNEQSRIDDKIKVSPVSPYVNPLAGNPQHARLHAQNQQAMFNAEKIRQHRAQTQRWTKAPPQMDSYMKAYHESQESHHLALEQQQANQRDSATKAPLKRPVVRQELKRGPKVLQNPEPTKITKADAIIKQDRNRNHRSYGSVEYQQYLQPNKYQSVYVSPAQTYDQGVTIKPNGNEGITYLQSPKEESKLYTSAIPSSYKYAYPKQYSQMHNYQSSQELDTISSLLKKAPNDQVSELNALINTAKQNDDPTKDLNTPIDLYFYVKDHQAKTAPEEHDQNKYAQLESYGNAYLTDQYQKDHTPITEEVDDVEDPNKKPRFQAYGLQQVLATHSPEIDQTTTKNNNYYKVEVASQIISGAYKPKPEQQEYYENDDEQSKYQSLQYAQQPSYYIQKDPTKEEDKNEKYLHHNGQFKGVQHLSEDGTGVSAYGDENLHYAANYEFGYRVHDHESGNDFGHHEAKRDGKTKGFYHVLLPDGRMQKVKYSAGPEGFHADISYDHLQYKN